MGSRIGRPCQRSDMVFDFGQLSTGSEMATCARPPRGEMAGNTIDDEPTICHCFAYSAGSCSLLRSRPQPTKYGSMHISPSRELGAARPCVQPHTDCYLLAGSGRNPGCSEARFRPILNTLARLLGYWQWSTVEGRGPSNNSDIFQVLPCQILRTLS